MLTSLTPTQLIIWILGVEVASMPFVIFFVSWVIRIWFKEKTDYTVDIMKRIINVLEAIQTQWLENKGEKKKDES